MNSHQTPATPVLIAGAGPTGLFLALLLNQLSIPVIIIDKALSPGLTSRAVVVHARTLEFYRQLGIADTISKAGSKMEHIQLRFNGVTRGSMLFGDAGKGWSAFPYVLILPQDVHEQVLITCLEQRGVKVRRGVSLVGFTQMEDSVNVVLKNEEGREEKAEVKYLAACDGAHSKIRELAGIKMEGDTYSQRFFVVDTDAEGLEGELRTFTMCGRGRDMSLAIPLKRKGGWRLIGPTEELGSHDGSRSIETHGEELTWEQLRPHVEATTGLKATKLGWFSTYRIHARVAEKFRDRKVFLLGDAAHLHSPVGGQGMNTGLGDAMNLGWKLAAVLKEEASEDILDTYPDERQTFAKTLVHTTDRLFQMITGTGWMGSFLRTIFFPYILPYLWMFKGLRSLQFQRVSQIEIKYRASKLSDSNTGYVQAGDRLPWILFEDGTDNYETLSCLDWQIHVYDTTEAELSNVPAIPIHVFPWTKMANDKGLDRATIYLIRPDGHIGKVCKRDEASSIGEYLTRWSIATRKTL